jgi:hypothetical protein
VASSAKDIQLRELKFTRIRNFRKKTAAGSHVHGRKKLPMRNFLKVSRFIRK